MKKCSECNGNVKEFMDLDPNGVAYSYYKCLKCDDSFLDMNQLHQTAERYRQIKRHQAKISKWGFSLAFRIPKQIAKKYNFKDKENVCIIEEKEGIRIVPC